MDVRDQYFSVANLKELFDNIAVDVILNFIREAGLNLVFKNLVFVNKVL